MWPRGTRRRWVVSSTPRPHFTSGKDPVSILQGAGWAPWPVWTGGKSRPHRDSIPDRPARSSVAIPTELPDPPHRCCTLRNKQEELYRESFMHCWHTSFVQKVFGLTTVHEIEKAYVVLTLIDFNIVPFRSYTLRPTFLPLLETFCELLFRDV